ncbi:hypothetical protein SpCBS45565_g05609 [Spizellomyces sp. 'palustris']|nr:hypothetical protein SpCBS45565_g05609 [Spizellomyces sp. 'palustris']
MTSIKGASDDGTHFIQKTIRDTERSMASLRRTLAGYLRNQERLRRKSLKLAVVLKMFSENEAPALSTVLSGLAELVTEREKAREVATDRINIVSQEPLKLYSMICTRMKNEVKARESAAQKEHKKQEQLDKILIKDAANRTRISQSQLQLAGATQDVRTATGALVDSVHRFESQKRADLQRSLGEFLWNEMNFHAQALEILTEAHQLLMTDDMSTDLAEIEERVNLAASRTNSPIRGHRQDDYYDSDEGDSRSPQFRRKDSIRSRKSVRSHQDGLEPPRSEKRRQSAGHTRGRKK